MTIFPTDTTGKTPVWWDILPLADSADSNALKDATITDVWTTIFWDKTTSDLSEWTNEYYTEAKVSANTDVAANSNDRHLHTNKATLDATTASFTSADETKLDWVEAWATANSTDAILLDRANHTWTQLSSTISDFDTAIEWSTEVTALRDIHTDTNEPSGFIREFPATMWILELSPDGTTIYRIDENWTFSSNVSGNFANWTSFQTPATLQTTCIYPAAASGWFDVYIEWIKYNKTTLESASYTPASWLQYCYYDENAILQTSQVKSDDYFEDNPIVSVVYWNITTWDKVVFADERHWISMSWATHRYLHYTEWTKYVSWLDLEWLTAWVWTYTQTTSWIAYDEDIDMLPLAQSTSPFWYIDWTVWTDVADWNLLAHMWTTYAYYNQDLWGWTYQLTEVWNNNYVNMHFVLTNDAEYPVVKIIWQTLYNSVADAQAWILIEAQNLVLTWLPAPEFLFIWSVIVDDQWLLRALSDWSLFYDLRESKVSWGGWTSGWSWLHADLTDLATSWHPADIITVDAAWFTWNLSWTDTSTQIALETIDALSFGTSDVNAIHDNVAWEIALITEKVTPASADLIIIEDSADSNNKKKVQVGNLPWGWGWETNTASNVGTAWVWVFKQKTWVDLEFKKLNAWSTAITITDDVANNEVDIDIDSAVATLDNITQITNRSHTWLSDIGSNTHSQIDSHIADTTTNPHSVTATNVWLWNVDNTSDATKNSATATLTNKTIALGNNTVSWTTAQFNSALTDWSFATLWGTETLTNKTLTDPKIVTTINNQTWTTYTLALTDHNKLVRLTNAAAITLTIPTNASVAIPIWAQIDGAQQWAGAVTVWWAWVTINSKDSNLTTNWQWVWFTLIKVWTDEWDLYGDLI